MADIEAPDGENFTIKLKQDPTSGSYYYAILDKDDNQLWRVNSDGTLSGSVVKDEDDLASDSAVHLATQQSIKAYHDGQPPGAHKDTHDPEDGSDALDTAAPSELASVQASGTGSSHSFARADHQHQIQHAITDNHLVTVDGTPSDDEYARWTANGLEGRTVSDMKGDTGFMQNLSDDSNPTLGGDLQIGEKVYELDPSISATDNMSGKSTEALCTLYYDTNVVFGDLLYATTTGLRFGLADAGAGATMPVRAMALDDVNYVGDPPGEFETSSDKKVFLEGFIRQDDWTFATIGADLFADAGTSQPTETEPSTTGDIVQKIGWVVSANTMYFCPSLEYETVP